MNGQENRIRRPWAHLFPQVHQNHSYLQNNYWWEQPEDQQKKLSTTQDTKKETQ